MTVIASTDVQDWTRDARFFEYTAAADPLASGACPRVPARRFPAVLHLDAATGVIPLDNRAELATPYPATTPALLASFVRVLAGDTLTTVSRYTSELFYVLRGAGTTTVAGRPLRWSEGDVFAVPANDGLTHAAEIGATLYAVSDAPLLEHLGVTSCAPRFGPTLFRGDVIRDELERVAALPDAHRRSRISVLLAHAEQRQTLTATPTLWTMFGRLPADQVQRPHRHQSVAVDLIVECAPGCFSLVGADVDPHTGDILDPERVDWEPGGAFVTPPGMWHSHHNESGRPAHLLPIQDAGLQTYLRSLDIRLEARG